MSENPQLTIAATQRAASLHPIGTLKELTELGIDPSRYFSCAPGDPNNVDAAVLGCPYAKQCRMTFKFKAGPENLGVLTVMDSGGRDTVEMPCYHYYARLKYHRLNGNGFEIVSIAGDGKTIVKKQSRVELGEQTEKGRKKRVIYERVKTQVRPFPRPKDNPILQDEIANVEIADFVEERVTNRQQAAIGLARLTATDDHEGDYAAASVEPLKPVAVVEDAAPPLEMVGEAAEAAREPITVDDVRPRAERVRR